MTARANEHVASYDIMLDGAPLAQEHKNRIKEIRVVDHLRLPDSCTLQITYPRGEGVDTLPFEIGKPLEVRLGAKQELMTEALFKGHVVTIEPEFGASGCSVLVRAFDRSQLLNRSRKVRTFQNQTSSDIVAKIVAEAGLSAECDSSGDPHEFVQQDNETDWDFIWRLAERIGFEFVVDDVTGHFRKPTGDGAVELEWPTSLRSFRPRVTAVQQVEEVTLLAQDPTTKEAIEASATQPVQIATIGVQRAAVAGAFPSAQVHVASEPVKSQAEAKVLTQALLDKLANGYVGAEGVAPGNPRIKAGAKVHVSGVGTKFGGTYRIATATHVLRGGGSYETHFSNGPTETLLGKVGSNGNGAPAFGAQVVVGVVTNNSDPLKMGRVRVNYPALGPSVEGAWARVVTPSAGNERGLLMLPVVGEEVLVAFEHDDTTRPYVLGSLFNGKDTPGDELLHDQDGSFVVRSDKDILMVTAEDAELRSGGKLTVKIGADVSETYSASWSNETQGSASLKATQPFEIEGQSVSIKGNSQVTIEGMTMLTLKCGAAQIQLSSAGVTISGPMVNLG